MIFKLGLLAAGTGIGAAIGVDAVDTNLVIQFGVFFGIVVSAAMSFAAIRESGANRRDKATNERVGAVERAAETRVLILQQEHERSMSALTARVEETERRLETCDKARLRLLELVKIPPEQGGES